MGVNVAGVKVLFVLLVHFQQAVTAAAIVNAWWTPFDRLAGGSLI